jgi:hypothetical protein
VYSLIDAASGTIDLDLAVQRNADGDRATLAAAVDGVSIVTDPDLAIDVHGLSGAVRFDDVLAVSTGPEQELTASRLVVSGEELKDVALAFHLASPSEVHVENLSFAWAGGRVRAEPFTIDPSDPQVAVNVFVEHVGLREAVALVTRKHATGEGTVSGSVAVQVYKAKLQTGEETYQVSLGDGVLRADEPGNLRMGDAADDFGEMMEQSDPRFRDDPLFREIKQDVLEAVKDFNFHVLEVRFRRDDSGEQRTEIRLHGRGRTGNRLPANLNLNVTGAEDVVNGYLAAQSRVLSSVKRKGR